MDELFSTDFTKTFLLITFQTSLFFIDPNVKHPQSHMQMVLHMQESEGGVNVMQTRGRDTYKHQH